MTNSTTDVAIIMGSDSDLPILGIGGGQLYKTEIPGAMNDQKLTPRIKETAQALWLN